MAATTLPASFQRSYNTPTTTSYDEFGAHSIPTVGPTVTSWDEEVVPALRKRLEAESKRLDQRIGQFDHQSASQSQQYQGRQQIKPVRRQDRAHEVLQDGLGSDDLIPSGWATGSTAQFAAIAPRAKAHAEDRSRSVSAHQPYTSHEYSPHHAGSSPTTVTRDSPSPSGFAGAQNISQAREKARRLAREREVQEHAQQNSPVGERSHNEQLGEAEAKQESRDNQRSRTISSPAFQRVDGDSKMAKQPLPAALPRISSKNDLREEATSRIPIPASRSTPKTHDQNTPPQDMRKTKSAARLNTKQTPPPQEDYKQYGSNASAKGRTLRTLQYNQSPSQHVLDEFGPLGGTPPKRGRRPSNTDDDESRQNSIQRSVSNPWDEEMIPTVKKRLEQQRMLEDMSRDEDLVDTWDRNGLPLSKTQVSLKQRASEGRSGGVEAVNPSPRKMMEPKKEKSVDEGSERMKRLQEQLDLGSLVQQSSMSSTDQQENHVREQRRQAEVNEIKRREHVEMQEMQEQQQQQIQQQGNGYELHNGRRLETGPAPAIAIPNHQTRSTQSKEKPVLAEVDAAGCCKCTIM